MCLLDASAVVSWCEGTNCAAGHGCVARKGRTLMTRLFVTAGLAVALLGFAGSRPTSAEEPKATGTVDIFSSVADPDLQKQLPGVGVIYGQKEWERLAAAWGIKPVP